MGSETLKSCPFCVVPLRARQERMRRLQRHRPYPCTADAKRNAMKYPTCRFCSLAAGNYVRGAWVCYAHALRPVPQTKGEPTNG